MTVEELKTKVGSNKFSIACAAAWKSAPQTGETTGAPFFHPANDTEIAPDEHAAFSEVCDIVDGWFAESKESDVSRVTYLAEVYRELPSYHLLSTFGIELAYRDLSKPARRLYWDFIRDMLAAPHEALADPISYDLWCGLFEDPNHVAEAWHELVDGAPPRRLLERVLLKSGPVPFALKVSLYNQLVEDTSWHYFIYRSLLHSVFDVYGDVDRSVARAILEKLALPDQTENLSELRLALSIDT